MISIDKFPAFNGNPPGVAVRFVYIEPTHEVVRALEGAGIEVAKAYRSWAGSSQLEGNVKEEHLDQVLDAKADLLLDSIGREIYRSQSDKLVEVQP